MIFFVLKVSEDVVQELFDGAKLPAIIHRGSTSERRVWDDETTFLRRLLRSRTYNVFELNKKKGKSSEKLFNLLKEGKDFENRNGWSTTVTKKKLSALKDTNIGVFMVNLTAVSHIEIYIALDEYYYAIYLCCWNI